MNSKGKKLNRKESEAFFKEVVLPRRARDYEAEEEHYEKNGYNKLIYRKITADEKDRGEPYPIWTAGFGTFAHFGVGIGIYFLQLLVLALTMFLGGIVMSIAAGEYGRSSYGITTSSNPLIPSSAACAPAESVTATVGCPDGTTSCEAELRPSCELTALTGYADLAMALIVLTAVIGSKFFESKIEEDLDEAMQTAQDYSVVVNDPDEDADNPDEWYEFFSRFGVVRYITITRKNVYLTRMICKKHDLTKKLKAAGGSDVRIEKKMAKLDEKLKEAFAMPFPTCRVYVTFELEAHQRHCLSELEVPDIEAILDLKSEQPRKMFREENVLDVTEPPEPDSILWENIELDRKKKILYECLANICTLLLLAACYFLVTIAASISPFLLSVVIAGADVTLPIMFEMLVNMSHPYHEGKRQSNLQVRLFSARLLLSTLFPLFDSVWNEVLTVAHITQIINVQLAACFVAPIVSFCDIGGLITRHCIAYCSADTQGELNSMWTGTKWMLAERYTGIAKILFVSLYSCFLYPIAPLIAMVAFLFVFVIDRYLLLRKWKPGCMLDAKIARRLRQQCILAVALHMGVTLAYIYSWPMDSVYVNSDGNYEKVDKQAPLNILATTPQPWMSTGQREVLPIYRIATIIVILMAIWEWLIDPIIRSFRKLFCREVDIHGDATDITFTSITKTPAYVPVSTFKKEKYLCSYIKDLLPKNRPRLIRPDKHDIDDLSHYVPRRFQPHVLSIVKFYGDNPDEEKGEAKEYGAEADDRVFDKLDTNTGYHIEDSATVTHPKYWTNSEGKLAPIVNEVPRELLQKIAGQTIPHHEYKALKYDPASSSAAAATATQALPPIPPPPDDAPVDSKDEADQKHKEEFKMIAPVVMEMEPRSAGKLTASAATNSGEGQEPPLRAEGKDAYYPAGNDKDGGGGDKGYAYDPNLDDTEGLDLDFGDIYVPPPPPSDSPEPSEVRTRRIWRVRPRQNVGRVADAKRDGKKSGDKEEEEEGGNGYSSRRRTGIDNHGRAYPTYYSSRLGPIVLDDGADAGNDGKNRTYEDPELEEYKYFRDKDGRYSLHRQPPPAPAPSKTNFPSSRYYHRQSSSSTSRSRSHSSKFMANDGDDYNDDDDDDDDGEEFRVKTRFNSMGNDGDDYNDDDDDDADGKEFRVKTRFNRPNYNRKS